MNDMSIPIPQIIQLFIMLVLGYGIFRLKVIDINFNKQVTKFVLYVSMPCMILVSAINQVGKEKEMGSVLFTFALAVGIYAVIAVFAFFMCKICKLPKRDNGVYRFVITFSNLAFMGFPDNGTEIITKSKGTNPDSENSIVIFGEAALNKQYGGAEPYIYISQVITKESCKDFTDKEIFPISKVEYTDGLSGAFGPVKLYMKDGSIKTVDYEEMEGRIML